MAGCPVQLNGSVNAMCGAMRSSSVIGSFTCGSRWSRSQAGSGTVGVTSRSKPSSHQDWIRSDQARSQLIAQRVCAGVGVGPSRSANVHRKGSTSSRVTSRPSMPARAPRQAR
jgi:hypothetical protein